MERFSKIYNTVALLVLNTILLLIIINIGILAYGLFDGEAVAAPEADIPDGNPLEVYYLGVMNRYDFDDFQQVYYTRSDSEIIWLLLETWNLQQICDDEAYFREAPYRGRYVTVTEDGYRRSDPQGPWPPDPDAFNIYFFGGSTTFAYGEADNLTIPSWAMYHLRTALNTDQIFVYNFGRASYYSMQEQLLFESLVEEGYAPDMAIFIDGLNDFHYWDNRLSNRADYCRTPESSIDRLSNTLTCRPDEVCIPMQRLVTNLNEQSESGEESVANELVTEQESDSVGPLDDEAVLNDIVERWLGRKRAIEDIAADAGVQAVFVMQPTPGYAYDLDYHLFADSLEALGSTARTHWGYQIWNDRYEDPDADWIDNVLNLTHLGEDNQGPIYVDGVHYSFGFMDEIGLAISDWLVANDLVNPGEPH